jgi:hypothetical protein
VTWTRLDDGWTDDVRLEQLPHDVRWHYLSLIQFCSRTARYDGDLRRADARRCSDVEDPDSANAQLVAAGFLTDTPTGYLVVHIAEHVPPPHLRDEQRKAAQRERKARERAHRAGDHSTCLPDRCAHVTRDVTPPVTRDVGTGRDGTGQALKTPTPDPWHDLVIATPGGHP